MDTQASYGTVTGQVSGGLLTFSGMGSFAQPGTADIAFPYDDVAPTGGADQSGSVSSGSPAQLAITLGAVH